MSDFINKLNDTSKILEELGLSLKGIERTIKTFIKNNGDSLRLRQKIIKDK